MCSNLYDSPKYNIFALSKRRALNAATAPKGGNVRLLPRIHGRGRQVIIFMDYLTWRPKSIPSNPPATVSSVSRMF